MVGYLTFLTISTAIFALFGLGLNLQWGFTGLINFGHVAFMTIGAYATVLLVDDLGVPMPLAVICGALLAAVLGASVGTATLRLREDYLAIVTIGVSETLRLVALNEEWLTRGARGVQGFPLPLEDFRPNAIGKGACIALLSLVFALGAWYLWRWLRSVKLPSAIAGGILGYGLGGSVYVSGVLALLDYRYKAGLMLLVVLVLATVYGLLEWLTASPWGRVLKAIREDEEIPRALGKNVFWYKLQAFMLGGAIAGVAGTFYAWQLTTVYPNNFLPLISFYAWTIVALGGAGNNAGVLLGSVIFWAYESLTRFVLPGLRRSLEALPLSDGSVWEAPVGGLTWFLDDARLGAFRIMVIGAILMALMVWRPQGILGKREELTLGR